MQIQKYIAGLICAVFAILLIFISVDGLNDDKACADVAIILGNQVYSNGELSKRLQARVDKGLELYKNGLVKKFIVSGGYGKEKQDEALAMKKYLLAKHVPAADVLTDNQGHNTQLTAINYLRFAQEFNFESVIVVSQFFHITRAKMALRKLGIKKVYGAHAQYYEWRDLYSLIREVFALGKYYLFS